MECPVERDDVTATRGVLSELHRSLKDLVTRVAEEERVDRVRRHLGQSGSHRLKKIVGVNVCLRVHESLRLVRNGLHHLRMAVARRGRSNARSEVQICVVVRVVNSTTEAAYDLEIGDLQPDIRKIRTLS